MGVGVENRSFTNFAPFEYDLYDRMQDCLVV